LLTVILRPSSGGTELEIKHEGLSRSTNAFRNEDGWKGSLELLERHLA
jgi:hypothetical protein